MYKFGNILIGKNELNEATLLLNKANRHGLITGASGSGKTITLKVLAEGFSEAGVPVFLSDVKGDLAGTIKEGIINDNIKSRINTLNIEDFKTQKFPVTFLDVYGKNGCNVRTTVKDIGSKLLSKMLNLTDTQGYVLAIAFKIAKDEEFDLIDLNDLKAMLTYIGEKRKEYSLTYGNVTLQSIGSIQRNILSLQEEGGDFFFGLPAFNIKDLIHFDVNTGFGNINIFDAQTLFQKPTLYATIMLWILTTIYNEFPEIGDTEKPKLVLFFDESHLIFNEIPEYLTKQIIQIVKLIRSKGVGIYFISQSPSDIPTEILSQLGNRIQHVLRSYTPTDEKAIKAASDSFRKNPNFNTAEVISTLKTGEALISLQNEDGEPTIVDKYIIVPPQSMIGTITDIERDNYIKSTWLYGKYEEKLNLTSTKDILNEKLKKEKQIVVDFEFLGSKYAYRKADLDSNVNQVTEVHYSTIYEFKKNAKNVFSIYMIPKDLERAKQELRKRNLSKETEQKRLKEIDEHIKEYEQNKDLQKQFDYVFINDYTEKAKNDLLKIIEKRRAE